MRVLIACEFSGVVRESFRSRGHDAWSCDLLPALDKSPFHLEMDAVWAAENEGEWDLMIAHPPCTYLAVSGARWWKDHKEDQHKAAQLAYMLLSCAIPRICLENPIGYLSTYIRKPEQIIQPWQFGHGEVKATCLWLKNLPLLEPTHIVEGRTPRVHYASPGPDRWKERSRTQAGIAAAMADQWGSTPAGEAK